VFQLYLLTVLSTVLTGVVLATDFLAKKYESFANDMNFTRNAGFRLILGIVAFLVGFVNLFKTYEIDIAVIGDLLPSLAGMLGGILLLSDYVSSHKSKSSSESGGLAEKVERFSAPYLTIVGVSSMIIGILHAILPRLPVL